MGPPDGIVDRLVLEVDGRTKPAAQQLPGWLDDLAKFAAAAVTALAAVTFASAHYADVSIKAARAAGITVEEYTSLAYVAGLAGVSTEALAMASRTVALTLSAAAAGSAEAAAAYEALGIDAAKATAEGLTFSELLPQIIDGLNRIPEPTRRTALAMKILGESGAKMATLIEGGGDALRKAADEARRFGVVVDTEAAVAAESLNDNTSRLLSRVQGLGLALGLRLVPAADRVVIALSGMLDAMSPGIVRVLTVAADALTVAIDALLTPIGRVTVALGATGLGFVLVRSYAQVAALASKIPLIGTALAGVVKSLGPAVLAWAPYAAAVVGVVAALDDLDAYLDGGPSLIGEFADAIGADSEIFLALTSLRDLLTSVGDAFRWAFGEARSLDAALAQSNVPILSTWARAAGYAGPDEMPASNPAQAAEQRRSRGLDNLALGAQAARDPALLFRDPAQAFRDAADRLADIEAVRQIQRNSPLTTSVQQTVQITIDGALDPMEIGRQVEVGIQRAIGEASAQVVGGVP